MTETDRERLIRQYAAREITWRELRERGFENYVEVLGALGALGLRPPVAPMQGPNSPPANAAAPQSAKPCGRDERVVSPHRHGHVAAVHACAGGLA
jgi:hypothetical protein